MGPQQVYDQGYADARNNRQRRDVFNTAADAGYYNQGYEDAAAGRPAQVYGGGTGGPKSGYAAGGYEGPNLTGRTISLPRGRHPDTGYPIGSIGGGDELTVTVYPLPGYAGAPRVISAPWPSIVGPAGPQANEHGVNLSPPGRSFVVQAPGDGGTTGAYPSSWYRQRAAEARARGDLQTADTYDRAAAFIAEQEKAQADPNHEYPTGYGNPQANNTQSPINWWRGPALDPNVGYELYGEVPFVGGEPFGVAQIADRLIPVKWQLLGTHQGDQGRGFRLSGPGGEALQLAREAYGDVSPQSVGLPGWVAVMDWSLGHGREVRLLEADEIRRYARAIQPRRGAY